MQGSTAAVAAAVATLLSSTAKQSVPLSLSTDPLPLPSPHSAARLCRRLHCLRLRHHRHHAPQLITVHGSTAAAAVDALLISTAARPVTLSLSTDPLPLPYPHSSARLCRWLHCRRLRHQRRRHNAQLDGNTASATVSVDRSTATAVSTLLSSPVSTAPPPPPPPCS